MSRRRALFLALFTASCVFFAWLALRVQVARSVAALEDMGVILGYDTERDSPWRRAKRFVGSSNVVSAIAVNNDEAMKYIGDLGKLQVLSIGGDVTDDGLRYLVELNGVERLELLAPPVSDAGLRYVGELQELTVLRLRGTSITNEGLRHLVRLTHLQKIDLRDAHISSGAVAHLFVDLQHRSLVEALFAVGKVKDPTQREVKELMLHGQVDDLMPYLARLATLERLTLSYTAVTGAVLAQVARLPGLEVLKLEYSTFPDGSLGRLKQLASLTHLSLGGSQITNADLKHIGALSNLVSLHLGGTQVTDSDLDHLADLRKLKDLTGLPYTNVTREGVSRLQKTLPRCRIEWHVWPPTGDGGKADSPTRSTERKPSVESTGELE